MEAFSIPGARDGRLCNCTVPCSWYDRAVRGSSKRGGGKVGDAAIDVFCKRLTVATGQIAKERTHTHTKKKTPVGYSRARVSERYSITIS
ncbi:unnamed protein product [Tuber melanosporum]|uniref:(Perigord truffle) hypothetical protein n=1 Tax=Tuber melanosporum (strain Mel28) TaxID=656061 RepID=D5GJP1_TUBMM|nr:uncharacterized protein GSTUM_00009093001 [Tuber melanosporum]CAZ84734.1 unnamed protein product [Tuber melanosporum]